MPRDMYIRDSKPGHPVFRRILILLLVVVLIGGGAFGYLLIRENKIAEQALASYQEAIARDDYAIALPLYRQIQERALTGGLFGQNRDLYDAARLQMEKLTDQRLSDLEKQLREGKMLPQTDLLFIENMNEITAVTISSLVRDMSDEFLSGTLDRQALSHALDQLSGLDNLKLSIGSLPSQLEQMDVARPALVDALRKLEEGAYLESAASLKAFSEDETAGSVVRQFAAGKLEEAKAIMYRPLLDRIDTLMDGSRFVSASSAIDDLMVFFPEDADLKSRQSVCLDAVPAKLVSYEGIVEQLVVKPLIVKPEEAFDGDSYSKAAQDSMLTTTEFRRVLEGLYENQYVLVDATMLAGPDGRPLPLKLPEGKKPLVLTIEGLNYYATRRLTGNNENLVLDEAGQVSGRYTDANGTTRVEREAEAIGILDVFVEAHPDFSFDGAKGTISLTGYECVFGYITDDDQNDDRSQALAANGLAAEIASDDQILKNRDEAKKVIDRLKKTGWIFASSTYGFIDARNQSMERIQTDTRKWLDQVGSLTGPVRILHYPNGAFINGSDERARYLISQGFTIFGGIGVAAYQFNGDGYLYVDKTPINGFTLRNSQTYQLSRLFDPSGILDRQ